MFAVLCEEGYLVRIITWSKLALINCTIVRPNKGYYILSFLMLPQSKYLFIIYIIEMYNREYWEDFKITKAKSFKHFKCCSLYAVT